ncbi:endo-beta-N-acetylglucosaminidase [Streptococcus equi subsp. zooepidemicus]|uniref:mannosyl-glycoprotein endo-beta-N-acetylglucosaminidase n=1 Tax=Streptococcus equi subsp. zooepidemicus (strain H70) TaxID=553483 RepID=C0MEC2_STRS7|nr:endo-beta-N-acetylglucosaminidase family protein [Streptococcus equi]MCD3398309.1 endo-beta-N-acetylglucosaminidase [Streptococcus equi subsp. zooepidemicus]MCD3464633.1 endo-beta-N-acetylglucosaminidase [Streptococcus equi subsp. zooepidemicus]CAX00350.1 endoglycosidase EndoS [Streptococcus equi subsp. zooepidemicus]HEL1013923.1 endo-beta-N-acetylglucosaminidase [Streptococcus equi subsp. zooepidemicus]HEL1259781.1 endo-beta-N-acetylglucosaminidase [Streptococcus equi subsp. zooepidemicus]
MEKQVLVKKTLKCVCAAALMVAILAAQHDSLVTVRAEDKVVQTSPSVSAIDDLHYLSENSKKEFKEELSKAGEVPEKLKEILSKAQQADKQAKTLAEMKVPEKIPMKPLKGPLYGGYFRTWHDKTSDPAEKDKVNSMGELPKEVDLAFVFHDWTKDYSLFWQKLATKHIPKLNKQGTRVIRTIPWRFLAGGDHSGIAEDAQKYPNTPEGNKALAKAIVDEYVYKYNLDGLDVDIERDSIPKVNKEESKEGIERSIQVFEEIGKLIGPKGADRSRLFIMDSTYMADKNPLIERGAPYIDLLLVQVYGAQGERGEWDPVARKPEKTMEERWESYSKYIRPEQYMVGFSFYEENAGSGNLWYDINERKDDHNPLHSEITGTRAERYAKWQPKTGGVKGGIFSYAIDRDGVAHQPEKYAKRKDFKDVTDKIFHSDYKVSKALKEVMVKDKSYEQIDETDFPDKALREAVIAQVGSRRGDLERFNGTLRLDNPDIKSLEGLNKLKKLAKLELVGLSQITKLDQSVLPENIKPTKDTLVSVLEAYKKDDQEAAKAIPQVALTISGLTGLKELNLAGFERETLAGIDAASLTSLEKVDLSSNKLDLAAGTDNRQILDTMLATVTKHGKANADNMTFDHQKPTGLYPDTYGTKSLQLPVANDTIDLQAKLLFGTVTNQGTLINSEADYKAYQEQEIAGRRFVDPSYDYKAFAVTYDAYKVRVTDSTLGVTDEKKLSTSKEETYKIEFFSPTNSTKPVHEAKVVVGEEKTMMVNLAEGATIIGGSADQTNAKKVFDGLLNNDTTTLSTSNKASIIFELKESGLVKHWRFFNDSAKKKEDYIKEAKLEAFVGHLEDSSKVKDSLEKSTEWVTVSDYSGEAQEFSQPLNNVGAKYWRITIDNKKSQYGYVSLPELQLIGYQLPAAYPVMATLAAAEELSQQKDKFSQKQLKELEVKVAALKAALDNKMFNADTINASFADVKAYVDKLLADAAGKKTPGKATKEAQLVTTDAKEKAESEKSKAD